jgi:NAD+ kinase
VVLRTAQVPTLMNIFIYGKRFEPAFALPVQSLLESLIQRGVSVFIYDKFRTFLDQTISIPSACGVWENSTQINQANFLISIGGDGTLLDTASKIGRSGVPVLGVNTGRLGFLSLVSVESVDDALELLVSGNYTLDRRSLIHVNAKDQDLGPFPYALNEITLINRERSSMITVHAYINDLYMSTYWADGLIVATPTGSTAYSLSCGGPIVTPDSDNVILTPIAPHNLNVRPLVISNNNKISLRAEGRDPQFVLSIDSHTHLADGQAIFELTKADFHLSLVSLEGQNFFNTIRNKMGWGLDKRN